MSYSCQTFKKIGLHHVQQRRYSRQSQLEKINKTPVINNEHEAYRRYIGEFFYQRYHQVSATHPLLDEEKDYFLMLNAAINRQDSIHSMVISLRNTIAALEIFEKKAKKSKYKATRYQSALDFGGNPYKPLIDLCKKLLPTFAINYFREQMLSEKIEAVSKNDTNNDEAWSGLQLLF